MRVRSRNSLKDLVSIFQSRREERIRNFIGNIFAILEWSILLMVEYLHEDFG